MIKGLPAEWGACSRTVPFSHTPLTLVWWKDIIAVGLFSGEIITLDAITGSQTAVLSEHTRAVNSLAFSADGTSLVSGSDDETVKLWDVQTGGVIKTFDGHAKPVTSVSISSDSTMIASGDSATCIYLWDIQRRECHTTIWLGKGVAHIEFSPSDPQQFISVSQDRIVQHWDLDGHKTEPEYYGSHFAFSLDGTRFVLCKEKVARVQKSDSGVVMARFYMADNITLCPHFSPDSRLVAVAAGGTIYIWDITCCEAAGLT